MDWTNRECSQARTITYKTRHGSWWILKRQIIIINSYYGVHRSYTINHRLCSEKKTSQCHLCVFYSWISRYHTLNYTSKNYNTGQNKKLGMQCQLIELLCFWKVFFLQKCSWSYQKIQTWNNYTLHYCNRKQGQFNFKTIK